MKILIFEDTQPLSSALKDKFERANYSVVISEDGDSALSKAKSERPDLILLDLVLPKKNGLDILKELKQDHDLKSIPVIVLSNLDEDSDIKECLKYGAEDYLVKDQHPIVEIVERVQKILLKS